MKEEFHKKEVEQSSVKKKVSEVQCQTKRDVQWILQTFVSSEIWRINFKLSLADIIHCEGKTIIKFKLFVTFSFFKKSIYTLHIRIESVKVTHTMM